MSTELRAGMKMMWDLRTIRYTVQDNTDSLHGAVDDVGADEPRPYREEINCFFSITWLANFSKLPFLRFF